MDSDCINLVIVVSIVFVLGVILYNIIQKMPHMTTLVMPGKIVVPTHNNSGLLPTPTRTPTPTSKLNQFMNGLNPTRNGLLPTHDASGLLPTHDASGLLPMPTPSSCVCPSPTHNASGLLPTHNASGLLPIPTRPSGLLPTHRASGLLPTHRASGLLPENLVHLRVVQNNAVTGFNLEFSDGKPISLNGFGNIGTGVILTPVLVNNEHCNALVDINGKFISLKNGNKIGLGGTNTVFLSNSFLPNFGNTSQPCSIVLTSNNNVMAYNMFLRLENQRDLYFNTPFPGDSRISVQPFRF
jgi:hypothetical protein